MSSTPGVTRTSTMMSLRWRGQGDLLLERTPVPTPAANEALIQVMWCGVCGSDLEEFLAGPVVVPGPVILGHEIVGRVAAPAEDGSGPGAGQIVVVDVVTGCGRCEWCRAHEEGLCPDLVVIGQHTDGGLAEYVCAIASRLTPVPEGVDPAAAALAEPTAVAVRAVRKFDAVRRRRALVIGGGTIGLLIAQVLRAEGAASVAIIEPDRLRTEVARELGFEVIWAADADTRAVLLADRFGEHGIDAVAECSGATGAAREAVELVRAGGQVVLLSVTPRSEEIDTNDIVLGEKTIHGSAAHMWDTDVAPAVELIAAGDVQVAPLITHRVDLARAAEAFGWLADPHHPHIKILIGPNAKGLGR